MPKVVDHDDRRQALAQAAADLIAREGVASATARGVARAAGVSTGTVSHYFSDTKALLFAAYQLAFQTSGQRFVKALAKDESFAGLTNALVTALPLQRAALSEWKVRMAFWGISDFADNTRRFEQDSGEQFRGLIAERLHRLQEVKAITLASTPTAAARVVESLLIGSALQHLLSPASERKSELAQRLREQVARAVLA